ncbi:MAG TPA: metallophosphoesterase family protein [Solirubrobacterales bacterium]|nr:metallophosphoesterase family protein [Solirubrobacterales bacterium]
MKLLAFSDVHTDLDAAGRLVEAARGADVVVCAGDLASVHRGLEPTVEALAAIEAPTVFVPGNNETDAALREACSGWEAATVLHGEATEIDGRAFFGLGSGVPVTPWEWSFDLTEDEAAAMLAGCPPEAILVVHSPPKGYVDLSDGAHLGSAAVLRTIEETAPVVALCGHIHESWGEEATIGPTRVVNLGPEGRVIDL